MIEVKVFLEKIEFDTPGELAIIDLSAKVQAIVKKSGVKKGIATVFVTGSTAAITAIEFEPGLQKDFPRFLEKIAPKGNYEHHLTWNDRNGHSHVRASLLKPDLVVPIEKGSLLTGTWQQIVLIELDTQGRSRTVTVTVIGE